MDLSTRLKGAISLVFGRGENGTVCSFCGQNRHAVELIVAGPATAAICNRCIMLCSQVMMENSGHPGFQRHAEKDHEQTIVIQLSHDELTLKCAERTALEHMLHVLAESLPESRLVGWSYMHAEDRFDLLTIEIITTCGLAPGEISKLAVDNWRRMRDGYLAALKLPANQAEPELIGIAATATRTAAEFAKAIGSFGPTAS
jgi:hypothetical protein